MTCYPLAGTMKVRCYLESKAHIRSATQVTGRTALVTDSCLSQMGIPGQIAQEGEVVSFLR